MTNAKSPFGMTLALAAAAGLAGCSGPIREGNKTCRIASVVAGGVPGGRRRCAWIKSRTT
jgi:hypothetical protein